MNRRNFTKVLGLSAFAAGLGRVPALARKPAPQFSITMDDFFWQDSLRLTGAERNQSILDTLRKHSIKAALFVIGRNAEEAEGKDQQGEGDAWHEHLEPVVASDQVREQLSREP